ncbi:MAG: hypothetical protein AB7O96_17425 [Pseudobdellovibrionaceae bacterium]
MTKQIVTLFTALSLSSPLWAAEDMSTISNNEQTAQTEIMEEGDVDASAIWTCRARSSYGRYSFFGRGYSRYQASRQALRQCYRRSYYGYCYITGCWRNW